MNFAVVEIQLEYFCTSESILRLTQFHQKP